MGSFKKQHFFPFFKISLENCAFNNFAHSVQLAKSIFKASGGKDNYEVGPSGQTLYTAVGNYYGVGPPV